MSSSSTDASPSHLGDILGQLILRVCKTQSETGIYTTVAKDLPLLIPADRVSVALLTPSKDEIEVFVLEGLGIELPKGTYIPCTQQNHIGHTILTQKPTLVTATEDSIHPDLAQLASEGLVSVMTTPLVVSGKALGALNVVSCQANLYRNADLSILTQIAALMATNIERLRLSQTAQTSVSRHQDYAERLEILNSIGQQLSSAMTEEYTFNIVAEAIEKLLGADRVSYVIANPDGVSCQIFALMGNDIIPKATNYPLEGSGIAAILKAKQAEAFLDLAASDYREHAMLVSQGLTMGWSVPIQASGEIVGILNAAVVTPVAFPYEVLTLLDALGGFMGTTIERINAQKKVNLTLEALEHQVLHDGLTGLPNRKQLNQAVSQEIAHRPIRQFAVLFIDLDDFKRVNDTLSHSIGDQLLCLIAQRLQQHNNHGDLMARMGGDEFVVVLKNLLNAEQVINRAGQLIKLLGQPFVIDKQAIKIGASIGISVFPEHGQTMDELMKHADIAMYAAKSQGRNHSQLYSTQMSEQFQQRLALEQDLRCAIANKEFFLLFQPQIASGQIFAVEALLRWQHPTQGTLLPGAFIAIAEETSLISEISSWVLEESLRTLAQLRAQHNELYVSVNISAHELVSPAQLTHSVQTSLQRYQLPGEALELELTESVFWEHPETAATLIQGWKDQGIRLAIDDFGTGFSSLSYLLNLPIDTLKIDRTFVDSIHTSPRKQGIVKTILALSENLNASCIAEGVETREQLTCLSQLGCRKMQGWLLSEPMKASALEGFINQNGIPQVQMTLSIENS